MKRRALLINPGHNIALRNEMYPTGALTLLKSVSREEGWRADIIQCVSDRIDHDGVVDQIQTAQPSIVGISVTTFQTKPTKQLTRKIKIKFPDILIVAGGAHISSIGEEALTEFPDVDCFVSGEGENAWRSLLRCQPTHRCVIQGTPADLDQTPLPDYEGIDFNKYFGSLPPSAKPAMYLMASRGCPFQCFFCSKSVYGSHVRFKSPETVMAELRQLQRMGMREIFFQDDTLNLNHPWFDEILDRILSEKLNMSFRAPFRANSKLVSSALLKKAKKAGFWLIFYGVESGNQTMLDNMRKGLKLGEISRAVAMTHEVGLKTEASFIIGLPWETEATIEESWNFYRSLKPFWAGFSIATPFPGTQFYFEAEQNGLILDKDFDSFFPDRCVIRTYSMDDKEIGAAAFRINQKVRIQNIRNLLFFPKRMHWAMRRYLDFRLAEINTAD